MIRHDKADGDNVVTIKSVIYIPSKMFHKLKNNIKNQNKMSN